MHASSAVERRDLRPVDLLLAVQRGDRRLQLVGAGAAQAQRAVELGAPLRQRVARSSARGPGRAARRSGRRRPTRASRRASWMSMSASRPAVSASSGMSCGEQAPEADRLRAQLGAHEAVAGAGRVALVEDEVDDGEHAGQAIGHLGVAGDAVGDRAPRRSCAWRARGAGPSSARARGRRARSRRWSGRRGCAGSARRGRPSPARGDSR